MPEELWNFWERVQYAINLAAEDAKYLDDPGQQELVLWQIVAGHVHRDKYRYRMHLHASWLRKATTILLSETGERHEQL